MDQVYQFASLNMGWCVNCHVNGYNAEGRSAGYATADAATPTQQDHAGYRRKKARYDCATCHY